MSKRTRTSEGWYERAKIARAINARINSRFPYRSYGRSYSKRGVAGSPSMLAYGDSWKTATPAQRAARKEYGYYGRGGIIADLGKAGGAALGAMVGGPSGASLGGAAGGFLAGKLENKVCGRGLYSGRGAYDANSLVTGPNISTRPSIMFESPNDESGTLVLTNKEYIGDVYGPDTSDFTNTAYDLNPGLLLNFPFLAQFAQNFEEYEFVQVVFEYHSTVDASSTNNPNGNTGTVIMATNYNVSLPKFQDKEQMIQYHGGVSGRMTDNLIHGVECEPSKSAGAAQKYIRTGIPLNQDLKTYDLGKFQIAFQNIPASYFNQQVGELWVSYKVKLAKPRLFTAQAGGISQYRATTTDNSAAVATLDSTLLTATGNSLPMECEWINLPPAQPFGYGLAGWFFTFPATANGVFEIKTFLNVDQLDTLSALNSVNMSPTFDNGADPTIVTTFASGLQVYGNVTPYYDMYSLTANGQDSSISSTRTHAGCYHAYLDIGTSLGNSPATNGYVAIAHVRVKAATAGTDNKVFVPLVQGGNTATSISRTIIVNEISPFQAISPSINHSQYRDTAGTLIATGPAFGPSSQ